MENLAFQGPEGVPNVEGIHVLIADEPSVKNFDHK